MARAKSALVKPHFHLHSLKLTLEGAADLEALAQWASDAVGRRVSGSACVRALITHAAQKGGRWVYDELAPFILAEMDAGATWGGRRENETWTNKNGS
jgi:hypothetical protein